MQKTSIEEMLLKQVEKAGLITKDEYYLVLEELHRLEKCSLA